MKKYSCYIDNVLIGDEISKAHNFMTRLKGLLGRKSLNIKEGMLITPCKQIHTWFMRFEIDVIYLSKNFVVLGSESKLKPWKIGKCYKDCYHVLELSSGSINEYSITPNERIRIC